MSTHTAVYGGYLHPLQHLLHGDDVVGRALSQRSDVGHLDVALLGAMVPEPSSVFLRSRDA